MKLPESTLTQLNILGYDFALEPSSSSQVYIRLILPKAMPTEVAKGLGFTYTDKKGKEHKSVRDYRLDLLLGSNGRKELRLNQITPTGKSWEVPLSTLEPLNRKGYGVYFVVNQGGRKDEDILSPGSIFYECDEVDKDEQWRRVRRLESELGRELSLIVETGKSLHCYALSGETFKGDRSKIGDWQRYQQRLYDLQDSDRSIENYSRLMRFSGFLHQKWDVEESRLISTPIGIVQQTCSVFDKADFDKVLPPYDYDFDYRKNKPKVAPKASITRSTGLARAFTGKTDNGWSMLDFAQYQEGFNPNGRKGWLTFKCPVHNGESRDSVHVSESTGAFKVQCGCPNSDVYSACRRIAIDSGYKPSEKQSESSKSQYQVETDEWQSWANRCDVEPTELITQGFLPKGKLPLLPGIILVDAKMGRGKTSSFIKGLVDEQTIKYPLGKTILGIPRNVLGKGNAHALGGNYHDEFESTSELNKQRWWIGCFDSWWKFEPDSVTPGSILILDELTAGINHLLNGGTIKGVDKTQAINRFEALIKVVVDRGGWVVGSVDGLSNVDVEYLRNIVGLEVPVTYTKSTVKPPSVRFTIYPKAAMTWENIVNHFAANRESPLGAVTDSKKELATWRRMLIESGMDEKRIIIIDSDKSSEQWVKNAIANIDEFILREQPLFFGFTPSLENGISIETTNPDRTSYFKAVAIHLTGTLSARDAKQLPFRFRKPIPRFGFVATKGFLCKQSGSTNPDQVLRELKNTAHDIAVYGHIADQLKKERESNLERLDASEATEAEKTAIRNFLDFGDKNSTAMLRYQVQAQIIARENGDKLHLLDSFVSILEEAGHEVELIDPDTKPDKALSRLRHETKGVLGHEKALEYAEADVSDMWVDEAKEILSSFKSTPIQRTKALKRLLVDKLPFDPTLETHPLDDIIFVKEFDISDKGRGLKRVELLWAARNPEIQRNLDTGKIKNQLKSASNKFENIDKQLFASDVHLIGLAGDLLSKSPLLACIESVESEWYRDTDEALIGLKRWAVANRSDINRILRLNCKDDQNPTAIFNKLARAIGFTVERKKLGKDATGTASYRFRICNQICDRRDLVLAALSVKATQRLEGRDSEVIEERAIKFDDQPIDLARYEQIAF